MTTPPSAFKIDCLGTTALISPHEDIGEFAFIQMDADVAKALDCFDALPDIRNVVLDFEGTDYFGSSMLGLFVRLGKRVNTRGGKMALCNLSEHEAEILHTSHLDSLWPVCATREDALNAVGEKSRSESA